MSLGLAAAAPEPYWHTRSAHSEDIRAMMRSAALLKCGRRVGVTGARLATGCHVPVRNLHNVTVSAKRMGMPRAGVEEAVGRDQCTAAPSGWGRPS